MGNNTKSILIKVSNKERALFGKLADSKGLTLKDLVLESTVYSNSDSKIKELEQQVSNLSKQLNSKESLSHELDTAKAINKVNDQRIKDLTDNLAIANSRIDNYSRQLEQQQQLNLSTIESNKELKIELDTARESTESKGFWARLFNSN